MRELQEEKFSQKGLMYLSSRFCYCVQAVRRQPEGVQMIISFRTPQLSAFKKEKYGCGHLHFPNLLQLHKILYLIVTEADGLISSTLKWLACKVSKAIHCFSLCPPFTLGRYPRREFRESHLSLPVCSSMITHG